MPLLFAEHINLVTFFDQGILPYCITALFSIEKSVREAVGKAHMNEL